MPMKKIVNIQGAYNIPVEYQWIARNQTGVMNGFMHAPIRDFKTGEWQDSVTGDYGYFIPYDSWETSVRKVSDLTDAAETLRSRLRARQKPEKKPEKKTDLLFNCSPSCSKCGTIHEPEIECPPLNERIKCE
jgi:hypothetical protein